MSYGLFEAATADDSQVEFEKKLAQTRLAQVVADIDENMGDYLSRSASREDYHDRITYAQADVKKIISKYFEGDTAFNAVVAKMEPHYVKEADTWVLDEMIKMISPEYKDGWIVINNPNLPYSVLFKEITDFEALRVTIPADGGNDWKWEVIKGLSNVVDKGSASSADEAIAKAEEAGSRAFGRTSNHHSKTSMRKAL